MSALAPHIRALRALADAFHDEADASREPLCHHLRANSRACRRAAERLLAEEPKLCREGEPEITYNPKGKA